MLIFVDDEQKKFHLTNGRISYVFYVMKNGHLGSLYFGKAIDIHSNFTHIQNDNSSTTYTSYYYADRSISLETIRQEYPVYGTSDYREPALSIRQLNGSHITNFIYQYYTITKGKPILQGLPATYTENDEDAETIQIVLEDSTLKAVLVISYTIFKDLSVITRSAYICNQGIEPFYLERFMSTSIDFPDHDFIMIQLSGAWSRERHIMERQLVMGTQGISSLRGSSSHQHNPFLAFRRKETTENHGEVFGFNLVYSSNFIAQAEVDHYDMTRITLGINPFRFTWKLSENEHFQSPEVVMVYSDQGMNGMSQTYHDLYRNNLIRGNWKNNERPILINNWEATYFNFNEKSLLQIAKEAKKLGIELFVLDDGWFGKRNNATSSLGDWYSNTEKFPKGIESFANKIKELGLKFGLWFEPEMVSQNSNLFKNHPDWIIHTPNRQVSLGRHQLVLDFSRKDVVDHIYKKMSDVIKNTNLDYIKWDMNRNITEAYSMKLANDQQDEFYHRYILGVYELYERLVSDFPNVLFESCAGGGGRFDPGLLFYAPQAWASDNTDPIERLKIQYGTSLPYPISSIGSHVSASPNHQTFRNTPLSIRANVAFFGTFGYELNPLILTEKEKSEIKSQIQFYKHHRSLIMKGDFYRLLDPFKENEVAWMVISKNKNEAIIGWYKILASPNPRKYQTLKLTGLNPNKKYLLNTTNLTFYGNELMENGIPLPLEFNGPNKKIAKRAGDFQSCIFHLVCPD
ncbi:MULTISPECIES: alpha-galactosidase [Bacillaceae]|uniref:Alpha-galactosidase n=1 Tax=Gottfriedia luciferensis TaxID=178774 RepID=A0ABX2ZVJ2_9BACI|nr:MULTISPECIES: alpha-galactosidase [Bacillaceae]ODG93803.1 alpha-galactosidase [Gottfriedia luciferensis]PGZ91192.1 alpha-galactosidase [Bacillus sp. AFS029533]SFC28226.1 alpha-galactosidase [Bacillus sp. UNCCL81]